MQMQINVREDKTQVLNAQHIVILSVDQMNRHIGADLVKPIECIVRKYFTSKRDILSRSVSC